MSSNFLEELVAEWYEHSGYFVRRNVMVGKLKKGGWECELDIVAFNPQIPDLVHVEPSMDANAWAKREKRYRKKFNAGKRHIPALFKGLSIPTKIDQIALFGFASDANHKSIGGGRVMTVQQLLVKIFESLKDSKIPTNAISENLPILRAYQFVSTHPQVVKGLFKDNTKLG